MIRADFLLFCEEKTSTPFGSLTLKGIFDTVYVREFPATNNGIIVFRLRAESEAILDRIVNISVETSLADEEGNKFTVPPTPITIEENRSAMFDVPMSQFIFGKPGIHSVRLIVDGEELMESKLIVSSMDDLEE